MDLYFSTKKTTIGSTSRKAGSGRGGNALPQETAASWNYRQYPLAVSTDSGKSSSNHTAKPGASSAGGLLEKVPNSGVPATQDRQLRSLALDMWADAEHAIYHDVQFAYPQTSSAYMSFSPKSLSHELSLLGSRGAVGGQPTHQSRNPRISLEHEH